MESIFGILQYLLQYLLYCIIYKICVHAKNGSMYVSGKLLTYPSPNLTFCPKLEVRVNVRSGRGGGGVGGQFPRSIH